MSFLFSDPFGDLVEKATSENLPIGSEDIVLNLDIADKIKAKEVSPQNAIKCLKNRINHKNPNVQLLTLKLTDTCVKNSGHHFLVQVASREFMDNLISIIRAYGNTDQAVRTKILSLIQSWGLSFKSKYELSYVTEVYETLKREGQTFPPIEKSEVSSAMIDTQTAPEWTDSDICMRCRTSFTTFNRKHHCRNCGQTFCQSCSSNTVPLPHLGIQKEVRVCDGCLSRLTSKAAGSASSAPKPKHTDTMSEEARREEEELERAIAASLAESKSSRSSQQKKSSAQKPRVSFADEEEDADLKAAIEASLKELKISEEKFKSSHQSGGGYGSSGRSDPYGSSIPEATVPAFNPNELSRVEIDNLKLFVDLVERMDADVNARGIGVMQHSQLGALYSQLFALQPKLMWSLDDAVAKYRASLELNEKITNAIQMYDRLLQERLSMSSGGYQRGYSTEFNQSNMPYTSPPPFGQYAQPYPSSDPSAGVNPWSGYPAQQPTGNTAHVGTQPQSHHQPYQTPFGVSQQDIPGQQYPPPSNDYPPQPQPPTHMPQQQVHQSQQNYHYDQPPPPADQSAYIYSSDGGAPHGFQQAPPQAYQQQQQLPPTQQGYPAGGFGGTAPPSDMNVNQQGGGTQPNPPAAQPQNEVLLIDFS